MCVFVGEWVWVYTHVQVHVHMCVPLHVDA